MSGEVVLEVGEEGEKKWGYPLLSLSSPSEITMVTRTSPGLTPWVTMLTL